ncbi:unnamed protein product [Cyprideis torosa]|uniref:Uncharacterized protein n=2 Tax=Cyprideis torosa TaxID=163714 RepID=A0A7R8WFV7_9CRUS|nr:unnamed protein product [Cyprideis torosa]CAG0897463.1 unnamed protein product [Cyprideis torosa]
MCRLRYWKMVKKLSKMVVGMIIRGRRNIMKDGFINFGIGDASLYHALVIIFLEFFAWGLLTSPMITVLNETFPDHTFLMNGMIVGVKGFLSFLSAPMIGALSDVWGRKLFLLVTVFFTCCPIPLMIINAWWYFAMISISGVFAVTFSVVFAYVADVTEEQDRSAAYGLVSATFAASLVISPGLGAYLGSIYGDAVVVEIATAVALLDVLFILVAVPESLPERGVSPAMITWEQADPFSSIRKVGHDKTVLLTCLTVFLSYLPEAGQYSCFFVYLRLVVGFSAESVALFIAVVGILSVVAQTALLSLLMKFVGPKHTIMIGLFFEMLQLIWYGFGAQTWMMWAAGVLASVSSITYPALSTYVSMHADEDKQGLYQGMVTGMRGLCNGLGPALYGYIFYLFHVDLNEHDAKLHQLKTGTGTEADMGANPELNVLYTEILPDEKQGSGSYHSSSPQSPRVVPVTRKGSSVSSTGSSSAVLPSSARRTSYGPFQHHKRKDSSDLSSVPLMASAMTGTELIL